MSIGNYLDKLSDLNLYLADNTENDIFDIFEEMYNLYHTDKFASMKIDIMSNKEIEISKSVTSKYPELCWL